jgi:hypothetical protein
MCARDLVQKPRRYPVSFGVSLLGEPVQIVAAAWIVGGHANLPQQILDRIAVGLLFALEHFPLFFLLVHLSLP